jgi:hypothetical protein
MDSKITVSNWYPEKKLLVTHISGDIDQCDIENWKNSLQASLQKIEDNEKFKILVNLHGFKAVDIEAHKKFRDIVPLTLAQYGWKVGYVDMFEEEAKKINYSNTRGIKCVGAAHCHQDPTKMELYETKFSSEKEHFFLDPVQAQNWIENLEVN